MILRCWKELSAYYVWFKCGKRRIHRRQLPDPRSLRGFGGLGLFRYAETGTAVVRIVHLGDLHGIDASAGHRHLHLFPTQKINLAPLLSRQPRVLVSLFCNKIEHDGGDYDDQIQHHGNAAKVGHCV